jgi:Zn-dependent protease with chaperone function
MFFFGAIDFLHAAPKGAVLLFVAAYFSRVICVRGAVKMSGSAPEALTTGELRDRIFELAKKAGVEIKHLFVLSAGKSQIANAFAAKSGIVMFTDYLLQRMTKREVDAIAGHELTHLRLGHPKKLGLILVGAVLAPTLFRVSWSLASSLLTGVLSMYAVPSSSGVFTRLQFDEWLRQWPHLDLVLVVTGFAFFYMRARTFERAADAGSVQLVGDPEAMITGLLKLSRLNLMPIQWGKVTGSIMTHPSTLKRVEHIAKVGNVSSERLREILAHHWQEQQAWHATNQNDSGLAPGEHYPVPESSQHVLSTSAILRRATNSLWFLVLGHVVPPALVVVLVNKLALQGWAAFAAYAAGTVMCIAAYSLLTALLGLRGRKQLRAAFARKFGQEGIEVSGPNAVLMGFSPGAVPRFYISSYNWDTGFFLLLRNRVAFVGEKIRFALRPEQIASIRIGPGGPGWWNSGRVYMDWRDAEQSREGTINLLLHEPTTVSKIKAEGKSLLQQLQSWQRNPASYPEAQSPLLALESPALGEVTSQSPKEILRGPKANAIAVMMFLVGYGVATLLSISPWYLFGVIVLLRIYEQIPYWRYRETQAPAGQATAPAARAQVGGAR